MKGMRDLKEDMYDSDIWFGMPGLGDRKIWRQRRDSGRRHKVTRYNCHDCTNTNITKIRVTRLHKRPRMSGDGWILCWKSFILSVESVTIGCGYDLDIYSVSSTLSYQATHRPADQSATHHHQVITWCTTTVHSSLQVEQWSRSGGDKQKHQH